MSVFEGEFSLAAGVESQYGILASNFKTMQVKCALQPIEFQTEEMSYDKGSSGANPVQLVSTSSSGSLDGYLSGSGDTLTIPAIEPLAAAAGLEFETKADHVAVTLVEPKSCSSASLIFHRSHHKHELTGWRSGWEIELAMEKLPLFKFPGGRAIGDISKISQVPSLPNVDFSGFKNPLASDSLSLQCSLFGESMATESIKLSSGNKLEWIPSSREYRLVGREIMWDVVIEEPPLNTINFFEKVGEFGVINVQLGQDVVDEGFIWECTSPNAQLVDCKPQSGTIGKLSLSFKAIPQSVNDELTMKFR